MFWSKFLLALILVLLLAKHQVESSPNQKLLLKSPKILYRMTRQAGRFGVSNYQTGQLGAYAVRGGGSGVNHNVGVPTSSNISGKGQAVFKNAARPVASGAYKFGGNSVPTNSRQPVYGQNFPLSPAGRQPSLSSVFGAPVQGGVRPQANAVYRGTAGRPSSSSYQG